MKHVVFYSGGISSYCEAKRTVNRFGAENTVLLFTDTKYEHEDLYRFLRESAKFLGAQLVEIADGRDPWQVFKDERLLGSSKMDPCSKILKRQLSKKWVHENYPDHKNVILHLGMNFDEGKRLQRSGSFWSPYEVVSLLMEKPFLTKSQMLQESTMDGIDPPELYELGFKHNNCGGFCVKAGHAHFRHLLKTLPEKYAEVEAKEEEMRQMLGKDISILTDRSGGNNQSRKIMTLKQFREREDSQCDLFDWGGCDCFGDITEEELKGDKQ
tara:strand:- start:1535 stop:2341 length:807 start_codon:yes stop_codon:yes gene_type:complete